MSEVGPAIGPAKRFRNQKCGCQRCSYCGRWLATRHEHDHFPVPGFHTNDDAEGGYRTRPACVDCHDLKDRIPLSDWPDEMVAEAAAQIDAWNGSLLVVYAWIGGGFEEDERDAEWRGGTADALMAATDALPYPGRLLMAKVTALAFHAYEVRRQGRTPTAVAASLQSHRPVPRDPGSGS